MAARWCGCDCGGVGRAAGTGAQNLDAFLNVWCGQNAAGKKAVKNAKVVFKYLTNDDFFDLFWKWYKVTPFLPSVTKPQVRAVINGMEAMLTLCEVTRAKGDMRADALRVLATSIEVVGDPMIGAALITVGTSVSGVLAAVLVETVAGTAIAAAVGAGFDAMVALAMVLKAGGYPKQLRDMATDIEKGTTSPTMPGIPAPGASPGPVVGLPWDILDKIDIGLPAPGAGAPTDETDDDEGGAGVVIGAGLFLTALQLARKFL